MLAGGLTLFTQVWWVCGSTSFWSWNIPIKQSDFRVNPHHLNLKSALAPQMMIQTVLWMIETVITAAKPATASHLHSTPLLSPTHPCTNTPSETCTMVPVTTTLTTTIMITRELLGTFSQFLGAVLLLMLVGNSIHCFFTTFLCSYSYALMTVYKDWMSRHCIHFMGLEPHWCHWYEWMQHFPSIARFLPSSLQNELLFLEHFVLQKCNSQHSCIACWRICALRLWPCPKWHLKVSGSFSKSSYHSDCWVIVP